MNGPIGVIINYRRKRDSVPSPLCKITTTGSPRPLESRLLSSGPRRRGPEKGERESSITIGNKSKADAAIARRARRGGWPIPQFPFPLPPADCFRQVQSDTRARMRLSPRRANFGFIPALLRRLQHDDFFQSDNNFFQGDTTWQFHSKCHEIILLQIISDYLFKSNVWNVVVYNNFSETIILIIL